ncbi:MAG: hypothetical protein M1812_003957 [Candelaria pacifica]|nr:MAG: hypothetical protein M1812_003957 [Candelaria pacifica]
MDVILFLVYSIIHYLLITIDRVDQTITDARNLLERVNNTIQHTVVYIYQSRLVEMLRSIYGITQTVYSVLIPVVGVLLYIICHTSKVVLDHYMNQYLGFFDGMMQGQMSNSCNLVLYTAPRYARTYAENLFYWRCHGERSGVAQRVEIGNTPSKLWESSIDTILVVLFVLILWIIWWLGSRNGVRFGSKNNEILPRSPQRPTEEIHDIPSARQDSDEELREHLDTTAQEVQLAVTTCGDADDIANVTPTNEEPDLSMNMVRQRHMSQGTKEQKLSKLGKTDPATNDWKDSRGYPKSCRIAGQCCGGADCEAEEYAVKMAYNHLKTIKSLRAQLKQQSKAKISILTEEHRRYQSQIRALETALADAENDLEAFQNDSLIEPQESETHISTTLAGLNLRKVLQRNEVLEKKARIGDENSERLKQVSEYLAKEQRTVIALEKDAVVLNNELVSRNLAIKTLTEEAEAARDVQSALERENTDRKQQLKSTETKHREACVEYERDYKDLARTHTESLEIEKATTVELRETIKALKLEANFVDQTIHTNVRDLQNRLNKAEALSTGYQEELTTRTRTAKTSEKGYIDEISDLKRRLEGQQQHTTVLRPTDNNPSASEVLLQSRITSLQAEVQSEGRWRLEASRLQQGNNDLATELTRANAQVQSVKVDCEHLLATQRAELQVELSGYYKKSIADEGFARHQELWRIEQVRLEKERDDAVLQSIIPGQNLQGSNPSLETLQRRWDIERTKLKKDLDDAEKRSTLADANLEEGKDDKASMENLDKTCKNQEKKIERMEKRAKANNTRLVDDAKLIVRLRREFGKLKKTALENGILILPESPELAKTVQAAPTPATDTAVAPAVAPAVVPAAVDTQPDHESEESDADDDEPPPRVFATQQTPGFGLQPTDPWKGPNPYTMPWNSPSHTPVTTPYNPYSIVVPPPLHNARREGIPSASGPSTEMRRWTRVEVEKELTDLKRLIFERCKDWRSHGVIHVGSSERDIAQRFDRLDQAWDELEQSRLTEKMLLNTDILDMLVAFEKTQWRNKAGNSLMQRVITFLHRVQKSFDCALNDDCPVFYIPPNGEGTLLNKWD